MSLRCSFPLLVSLFLFPTGARADDPLPSWNEGPSKAAVLDFVARVTKEGGPDFVPMAERIAAFDNDGTLWSEQPTYFQLVFAGSRLKTLAVEHPEWIGNPIFEAATRGDFGPALKGSLHDRLKLVAAGHPGLSTEQYDAKVATWLATARHPRFDRPYTDLVYQPMLEVLAYLRARGFKTYIVSGGTADFIRVWSERAYGVPPEQVVGSAIKVKYELREGIPEIVRVPEVDFIDDGVGKPVGIHRSIGRRPILAFGNSDGDYEMLRWVTAGPGPRLGLIVHHTDAVREWAYDRDSLVGRLARALDEAPQRGWSVISMKRDWKVIYPFEKH